MFIALYTNKQLKQLKRNLLLTGLFLTAGGIFALVSELQNTAMQYSIVAAAALVLGTGLVSVAVSRDMIPLKDAYFLMNPSRLGFRLTLLGKERVLQWTDIQALSVTEDNVVFLLQNNKTVTMHLSTIPDEQTARHIRASIRLAALEQNINVNGVVARAQQVQAYS